MNLSKNNLFYGIVGFLILVNILAMFNINQFYIRTVLSFIFLIIIPGLLIMLMLKIREVGFWEYLVCVIGLSVAFIMFGGLAVNWILPVFNITDKPLTTIPILICFNIFLIILGVVAWMRNRDFKSFKIQFPKLDLLNIIMFTIPIFFPVLSILGVFLLNNNGTNILTMITLGSIAIYVIAIVFLRKKLHPSIYPWALYLIGLSLILMGSLRGWYISSTDAALENYFSTRVLSMGQWDMSQNLNGYNAMLSIVILPPILSLFSNINLDYVIKLLFPIIFSLIGPVIFLFGKKYFSEIIAFLGGLLFIFQPTITAWTLFPPRQEIAFLFLALFLYSILANKNKILLIIFSFSIIVSHYSTSYIFAFTIIFASLIYIILKYFIEHKSKLNEEHKEHKFSKYFIIFVIIFLFGFLWLSQITTTADGLISFSKQSISKFDEIFSEESYSQGFFPLEYLMISQKNRAIISPFTYLKNYESKISNNSNNGNTLNKNYPSYLKSPSAIPATKYFKYYIISEKIKSYFILFLGILIVLGILVLFYFLMKNKISLLSFSFILSLFLVFMSIIIIPSASGNYNLNRLLQQILILLSPFCIYGFYKLIGFTKKLAPFIIVIFLILYLIVFTHAIYFYTGGSEVQLRFANIGKDYNLHYTSENEILSSNWLYLNKQIGTRVFVENYARFKMYQSPKFVQEFEMNYDILPSNINRDGYIYASQSNIVEKITFKFFGRGLLTYNFPTKFLNDNKNKIYANGESEIFK